MKRNASTGTITLCGLSLRPLGEWPKGVWSGFRRCRRRPQAEIVLQPGRPPYSEKNILLEVRRVRHKERPGLVAVYPSCLPPFRPGNDTWRWNFAWGAAHAAGFLTVHAACVAGRRGALVFLGHSGAGKTTISRRLLARYPLVHEDKVVVDPGHARRRPTVLGSRLALPHRRPATADRLPLAGLFLLRKSRRCALRRLPPSRILLWVLQGRTPNTAAAHDRQTEMAFSVAQRVPCYELEFNLNAAEVRKVLAPFLGAPPHAIRRSPARSSRGPRNGKKRSTRKRE